MGEIIIYDNNPDGTFSLAVTSNIGDWQSIDSIWTDDKFIYVGKNGNLTLYELDSSKNINLINSTTIDMVQDIIGDDNFIYLPRYGNGLYVYSVDTSGNLTLKDSDDRGGYYTSLDVNNGFIYANGGSDLHIYSVDENGTLTFKNSIAFSDNIEGIKSNGDFVFVSTKYNLFSYSIDSNGNGTLIDSDYQNGEYEGIFVDQNIVYVGSRSGGIFTYRFDASGYLTYVDNKKDVDNYHWDIWKGNTNYVYVIAHDSGIVSYKVS